MERINLKKLLAATVIGGLVMFVWGGLSHTVIFIGTGFKPLPNEDKITEVLKQSIPEQGLYFFPGKDFRNSTQEQELSFEYKFKNGPAGLLVYRPVGGEPFASGKLINQFLSGLLSAFIAAAMASLLCAGFWRRVLLVTLLGVVACSSVSTIYWNWYEFPTSFFVAQILDMVIGFFLAGLAICKLAPGQVCHEDTKSPRK